MEDLLSNAIRDAEQALSDLEHRHTAERNELVARHAADKFEHKLRLETLRLAAELRPIGAHNSDDAAMQKLSDTANAFVASISSARSRGRQLGAITKRWRDILRETSARFPDGANDAQVAFVAQRHELPNIRKSEARRQMEGFQKHGYVREVRPGEWVLTESGLQKFGPSETMPGPETSVVSLELEEAAE